MISIIIPTYNEEDSVQELISRIHSSVKKKDCELLVVDDNSGDSTCRIVRRMGGKEKNVRLLKVNFRDLSKSVVHGFREARGNVFVVMDADLQHPPSLIPKLVKALGKSEFAVGCRTEFRNLPFHRVLVSRVCNFFVRFVLRVGVRDPMSGFFAVRRNVFERAKPFLKPKGYKIMLELLVKSRSGNVFEVPFVFCKRAGGKSKFNLKVFLNLIAQVTDCFWFRTRHFFK